MEKSSKIPTSPPRKREKMRASMGEEEEEENKADRRVSV